MIEVTGNFNYSQKQMFSIVGKPHIQLILISATTEKQSCCQMTKVAISQLALIRINKLKLRVYTSNIYFGEKVIDVSEI